MVMTIINADDEDGDDHTHMMLTTKMMVTGYHSRIN